jgi:hypothetical protein
MLIGPRWPQRQSKIYLIKDQYVMGGAGFGGFLDLREKLFFLSQNTGGCVATADRVFFIFEKHL